MLDDLTGSNPGSASKFTNIGIACYCGSDGCLYSIAADCARTFELFLSERHDQMLIVARDEHCPIIAVDQFDFDR